MTSRALLFTDVVDSTLLAEKLGDVRAAEMWVEHDRRARDLLVRHHGREIDRSDGFLLLFDETHAAAAYALDYHQALAGLDLAARVGLHTGPVTLRENAFADVARGAKPVEVEGLTKRLAARIMALARGGQTLLSAAAVQSLGESLPSGAQLESHGNYRLKGLDAPLEIFELGVADAPFAPPPDFDKGYRVVRADDLWRPLREVRHNLPAERDPFVGRSEELRSLAARLDAGTRLLTVLGTAGTGKTRLVRRFGWTWLGDWPGGIHFCDLSEARSLDGIFFAVASALEVPLGRDDPAVQLGHAIAAHGRCLVLLDNFEQVTQHAKATLGRWLDRASDAAFVVTSRERLHLPGEEVMQLEPLPLDEAAVELFAVRAKAQRSDFAVNDGNRAAVDEVVRLLDGLPLAIELAAARVVVLSPAQLVARMRDRFAVLAGVQGAAARQATLRAAIDWSWDLLTAWEQAALAQCAVFEGGFALEAAEAVLDLGRWSAAPPTLDVVQALVDKSLLRSWVPAEQGRLDIDEPYFGMYVSIHEYAREKLHASGVDNERHAEERHGCHFAKFGTDDAIEGLSRHGGVKRRRALAMELDNLVAACRRAVARSDGETAVAIYRAAWRVLEVQGPFGLAAALGTQVLALESLAPRLRILALLTEAPAAWRNGNLQEASVTFQEALALARGVNDLRREADVLLGLGYLRHDQGRMEEARACFQSAITTHHDLGNRQSEGRGLLGLGVVNHSQGALNDARAHFDAALAIARNVGDRQCECMTLSNMAAIGAEQGRMEDSQSYLDEALSIACEAGDRRNEAIARANLGVLHYEQGRIDEARPNLEASLAIHRALGNRVSEAISIVNLGVLHLAAGSINEARIHYDRALAINRELGNRRHEGIVLRCLAELLTNQRMTSEAESALELGERRLREVGDRLELAKLLCTRGHLHAAKGDVEPARAALSEAEALGVALSIGTNTELGRGIAQLRASLG
jgi:predicted ATPase/class 3 adenylate cyclase